MYRCEAYPVWKCDSNPLRTSPVMWCLLRQEHGGQAIYAFSTSAKTLPPGGNIFLPKHCVPFCEFFLVTVWYANVHMLPLLDKRKRDERVLCFPAFVWTSHVTTWAAPVPPERLPRRVCTAHPISATLPPPHPVPFPSYPDERPTAPAQLGHPLSPASGTRATTTAPHPHPELGSWESPLYWHTAVPSQFVVETLLFFFFFNLF